VDKDYGGFRSQKGLQTVGAPHSSVEGRKFLFGLLDSNIRENSRSKEGESMKLQTQLFLGYILIFVLMIVIATVTYQGITALFGRKIGFRIPIR